MRTKFTAVLLSLSCALPTAHAAVLDIHRWQTGNGALVLFVPAKTIPMVDIQVAFAAGSARDQLHPGVAGLTSQLLNQGSTTHTADQLAEELADVGAQFGSDAARDMSVVTLRTLSDPKFLNSATSIFQEIITKPAFPLSSFKRVQDATLMSIAESNQQPEDIANRLFYASIYGNHPYAHPIMGTTESVKAINLADVQAFYQKYFTASNAVVAIVGDLTEAQAKTLAEKVIGQLPRGEHAPNLPEPKPLAAAIAQHRTFPSSQTNIRMGQACVTQNTPDYYALAVGNYTLGGGMLVSRLAEEVREKRGLSYSVYSSFQPMATKGPFIVSLGTKNATAKEALSLTQTILGDFLTKGPSSSEIDSAKKYLTGSFALRLDSNKAIAAGLLSLGFYQLPMDFYDTYIANIEKVDHDAIQQAFNRHVQLKQMATISVGGEQGS